MKRLHIHISVPDLDPAIHFYSQMFAKQPSKQKTDYAQWQLEEPQVNFAISTRSKNIGLDHLGIQVTDHTELAQLNTQLAEANIESGKLDKTTCCYAESVKSWSVDPAGIPWESFMTMKDAEIFGTDNPTNNTQTSACCSAAAPNQNSKSSCC